MICKMEKVGHSSKEKERHRERSRIESSSSSSKDSKSHHQSRSQDKDRQKRSKSKEKEKEKEKHHSRSKTTDRSSEKTSDNHHCKKEVKKEAKDKKEDKKQVDKEEVKDSAVAQSLKNNAEEAKSSLNNATDSIQPQPATDKKEEQSSKQEPTSTVSIRTPEEQSPLPGPGLMWKGIVNSSETGKFSVQAYDLSLTFDMSDVDIPGSLDIVGRIRPEMVWDYVNQTRKAGSRDILIVKLSPSSDGDKKNYSAFLSHMCKCNRFAVVGLTSKLIKDFYIVPLPKDSPIPLALTSLAIDIKNLDENRTSMLLGVVVRARRKRSLDTTGGTFNSKSSKVAKTSRTTPPTSSGTSTASPSPSVNYIPTARNSKRKESTAASLHRSGPAAAAAALKKVSAAEMTPSTTVKDVAEDIPYSPGQLLNDTDAVLGADLVEQQAMLDELNRKIEEQKKQLASMETEVSSSPLIGGGESVVIPGLEPVIPGLEPSSNSWSDSIQAYDNPSPPRPPSTGLNQISIPTNLQEILSSIQKKETEMKQIVSQSEALCAAAALSNNLSLGGGFFPPQDVDMRIPVTAVAHPPEESNNTQRDPRRNPASSAQQKAPLKKKSLKQLTDEELLAKAMEMEMESGIGSPAGNTNASAVVAPYFSPPPPFRPSGPPPSMGGPPPSMMAPPHHRPFLPPYIRGPSAPPYNHPPPAAAPAPAPGGYRPRHKNNR